MIAANLKMNNPIRISKRLAFLLRHSSLPDRNGWVRTEMLLEELSVSLQDLKWTIVADDKGRFEFSKDNLLVRALYGHSINVDLGLSAAMPPAILYHGTAEKFLERILHEGLKPRKRKYVHLSETMEMAEQVGARHGMPVVLSVDVESMVLHGYNFYKAKDGVWLTEQIPAQFIKKVHYG